MTFKRCFIGCFAAIAVFGIATEVIAQTDDLHVGAALADITPAGDQARERGARAGAHDPLRAKALVFRQGTQQAAIVICDLINVSANLTGPTRRLAAQKTGIPIEHIAIAATHTHTGPRGHNDLLPGDESSYAAKVRDAIVDAIVRAHAAARPAQLAVAATYQQPVISFNRRFHLADGTVRMNPGFQNPSIVRPEGPIDPELRFLLARDAQQRPIASLTNFALHLDTVGGNQYSADYPYYIEQSLQAQFGQDFVSLFGTGCCGDVNHYDVTRPGPQRGHVDGYQTTKYLGEAFAKTIQEKLMPALSAGGEPSLAVRHATVHLPLQTYTDAELAWAQAGGNEPLVPERPFLQGFRRSKILSLHRLRQTHGERLPVEVQVFRLTPRLAVVTLPGEIFTELGKAIKTASPFEHTLVIELANDNPAYVPTRWAMANGDYEAVNSRLQAGGGEAMVQVAVKLLHELQ
jgi:hypothetical protein